MGPPGAGKGTQAALLSSESGMPHISTGDLFRHHITTETALGRQAQRFLDAGELVPDHITNGMVRERLAEPDAREGFLLDGFPRTVSQAEDLARFLGADGHALDAVIEFDVPESVVTARLLDRGRQDDDEAVIRHRQQVYREQTAPLRTHYSEILVTVSAAGPVAEIASRLLEATRVIS
jgi:adenylate kinase